MAIVERAVTKPSFGQLFAERFKAAFISLGIPVIGIVFLSILAALLRDLF